MVATERTRCRSFGIGSATLCGVECEVSQPKEEDKEADMKEQLRQLQQLRQLRENQLHCADDASEYLHRAGRGMSYRRATDIGGTHHCPLEQYSDKYQESKALCLEYKRQADTIWAGIKPRVQALADFDAQCIIEGYYNQALSWDEVHCKVKRSAAACQRLHSNGIREMIAQEKEGRCTGCGS